MNPRQLIGCARRAQLTWRGSTQLIVDLATYERAADQVRSTPDAAARGPVRAAAGGVRAGRRGGRRGRRLRPLLPQLLHLGRRARDLPGGPLRRAGAARPGSGQGAAGRAGRDRGRAGVRPAGVGGAGLEPALHRLLPQSRAPSRWTSGPSSGWTVRLCSGCHRTTPTGGPACRTDWALTSAPPSPRPRSPTARPSPPSSVWVTGRCRFRRCCSSSPRGTSWSARRPSGAG